MQTLYKLPEYYKALIEPFVNTELEVSLLDEIFNKYEVKSVLDVACGHGRHSIALTKKGYDVIGIDYSQHQIKKAREDVKGEGVDVNFIVSNANKFSFKKKFDAAICMWSTLGEEPLKYQKVMRNVYESLEEGGIFVIDNTSWECIPENMEDFIERESITENGDKIKTKIHDRFTENFRIRNISHDIDGEKYNDLCVTHILREGDWIEELKKAGFRDFEVYNNYGNMDVENPHHLDIVAIK
ncbi:MAG: class I SAM-dependent methyltransferase [Candidatus Aenigmatarchaeota archaeon]